MNPVPELTFVVLLLLSQLSPGPDQTLVTRSSLRYGLRAGVIVSLGIGTGVIAHAVVACTLGSVLLQSAYGWLFYDLAALWLIYLAWKIMPRHQVADADVAVEEGKIIDLRALYKDALVCNLMNPKATLFFIALSAPLLEPAHGVGYSFFVGSLIVVTGTLGWIIWAFIFQMSPIRAFYKIHAIGIDRVFALALFFFACSLFAEQFIDYVIH
ncbi:MAG: LysE family translocator [Akkermansia sp.]